MPKNEHGNLDDAAARQDGGFIRFGFRALLYIIVVIIMLAMRNSNGNTKQSYE